MKKYNLMCRVVGLIVKNSLRVDQNVLKWLGNVAIAYE